MNFGEMEKTVSKQDKRKQQYIAHTIILALIQLTQSSLQNDIPRIWINMTLTTEQKTLNLSTKNLKFSILAASQQCRRSIVRISPRIKNYFEDFFIVNDFF